MKQETILNTTLAILSVCAVVVTGITIQGRWEQHKQAQAQQPVKVKDWRTFAAVGHRMGPDNAPVTITEFSDFQCPFCRRMHDMIKSAEAKRPGDIAVVYRHYPLSIHKNAMPAAIAAECAGVQGKFQAMHDALFSEQDSLGAKPWSRYAATAGVPDIAAFDKCLADPATVTAIARDTAAGNALKVTGTPTLIINDLKIPGIANEDQLNDFIKSQLKKTQNVATANQSP